MTETAEQALRERAALDDHREQCRNRLVGLALGLPVPDDIDDVETVLERVRHQPVTIVGWRESPNDPGQRRLAAVPEHDE